MSLETRATALLLVAVRENVPEPIESVMTALKAESNRADSSINMAVHGAKRCLIALREIEITRGVKATRDVKATPDVLTMCASSDEEKQAAKTAWDVKIAAKIVKRKAAQKLNREKPSVLLATANRKLEKRKASQLEFGKDEEGNYNTPQDKNRRQKREANQLEFGKDEEGNSNIPADKQARQKLIDYKASGGAVKDFKRNVDARKPARREKRRLLVEKNQLAAAHETSRRNFQHSIHKYGELC